MTFKTDRPKLEGMELLLRVLLAGNKPANIAELLINSHISKLYTKVRAKIETPYFKAINRISMTEQEAWALRLFYANVKVDAVEYKYEALNLQSIINQIDQISHGQINRTNYTNRGLAAGTSARRLGGKA